MFSNELTDLASTVLQAARDKGVTVATAESCTGGLVVACLTEVPGSSDVVDRGFVVYSNDAKSEMLGVPMPVIARHGAVSEEVVRCLAEGVFQACRADLAVSISGIAGPGGGSAEKPVGLVHFAIGRRGDPVRCIHKVFAGDRAAVREQAVYEALELLLGAARSAP